jgi:putative ABC transport system permease protein
LIHLVRLFSLRHFSREKWKSGLTILGIALGVAVFISIRISIHSALDAFRSTVDHVAGKTHLEVTSPGKGFDENLFLQIKNTGGIVAATPVVQYVARSSPPINQPLFVLGIDIFTDRRFRDYQFIGTVEESSLLQFLLKPRAIAITKTFAEKFGLHKESRLDLLIGSKELSFIVKGIMEEEGPAKALGGNFAILDIAHAQEAFDKVGLLDRIDLLLDPRASLEAVAAGLREKLPPNVVVRRPQTRNRQVENMIGAFRLNLTALSFVSLFVGMFLIYNSMSISVIRRRREIGILRSLGVSERQVLTLFLAEGAILGVLGAILGIGIGLVMAKFTLASVSKTVTALYILVKAERLTISPITLLLGAVISVGVSVISAAGPAREAARTKPREALSLNYLERKVWVHIGTFMLAGLGALALALIFALQKPVLGRPVFGFASAFLILVGFSLITPGGTRWLNALFAPVVERFFKTEGRLASHYVNDSLTRTAITIAALMTALAMLISISIMILSFRKTVAIWVDQAITADIILTPASAAISGWDAFVPPEVVEHARGHPDVEEIDTIRVSEMDYGGRVVLLWAAVTPVLLHQARLRFLRGDEAEIIERVTRGGEVIVSETFSMKFGLREGQDLLMQTPGGLREFRIAGVFYDYTTENGMIIVDLAIYRKIWGDVRINRATLYLKDPSRLEEVRRELVGPLSGKYQVLAVSNRELRDEILRIFDQTFAIAHALKVIAFIVAILGIINSMLAMVIERERDIGILRAIGTFKAQIRKMTLVEAQLMGLVGFVLGAVSGVLLSMVLIYVINKQSFGWTIQFFPVPSVFVQSLVLVVVASLLAGLFPAHAASKKTVAESVKME